MKLVLAIIAGFILGATVIYFAQNSSKKSNAKYIQLEADYQIENVGELRKGTIIKIDRSMPEGFTRYVLYLNLKGDNAKGYTPSHKDEIIPYWLQKKRVLSLSSSSAGL